jgi:hypothetical protein
MPSIEFLMYAPTFALHPIAKTLAEPHQGKKHYATSLANTN